MNQDHVSVSNMQNLSLESADIIDHCHTFTLYQNSKTKYTKFVLYAFLGIPFIKPLLQVKHFTT